MNKEHAGEPGQGGYGEVQRLYFTIHEFQFKNLRYTPEIN